MDNIVSFETAKRLKEAGFPQPEPQRGQVWYSKHRAEYLVYNVDEFGADYSCGSLSFVGRSLSADDCVFAPTATDILRLFNNAICISVSPDRISFDFYVNQPLSIHFMLMKALAELVE